MLNLNPDVDAVALYHAIDNAPTDAALARSRDFSFMTGLDIDDPFDEVRVKSVRVVDVSVQRDNVPLDGTISLRFELAISLKGSSTKDHYEDETAVFWINSDNEQVVVDLTEVRGVSDHEFRFDEVETLAKHFNLI